MLEPIPVRIAHHVAGRTRLTAPASVAPADLQACAARLAASGGIAVEVRGASLILTHAGHWPALDWLSLGWPSSAAALEAAGLLLAPVAPRHPIGQTSAAMGRLNAAFAEASNGRMDLTNAAFVGLVAAGIVQLARGHIAGPALTLFGQALTVALLHARIQER
ncbi:hypothetical protein [Xanthobacter sediminis]